jgi:tetratricopeptide (TPR) repeat protein
MHIYSFPNKKLQIAAILFVFSVASLFVAQELTFSANAGKKSELAPLQDQARNYRINGLAFQRAGNLDQAMAFYQKAIELDPSYGAVYNDLGVLFEAKGLTDRAEDAYLKAVQVDPSDLSAYTNLALIYEAKRDLNKAYFYWDKRAQLGLPDDPWTKRAHSRLKDINIVLSNRPREDALELEVSGLVKDIAEQKAQLNKDSKALAKFYFEQAKLKQKKGDDVTAFKLALDASQLDPTNAEIEEFMTKIQGRLLSR